MFCFFSKSNIRTRRLADTYFHHFRTKVQEKRAWETKTTLIFTYADGKCPAPTFSSALVSRRYSVRIALHLEGVYHGTLELEVPLQIIYKGNGQNSLLNERELVNSEAASSIETLTTVAVIAENEQAPDYVR